MDKTPLDKLTPGAVLVWKNAFLKALSKPEELAGAQPEVFQALLLTLVCGLRRSEADSLMWSQIDLEAGSLEVMDTEHKALKSADSAGKIGLDAELVTLLRGLRARAGKGVFVLETPKRARVPFTAHQSRTYRCDATFKTLVTWLQAQGVQGHRSIHTLRKEIGSVIASRDGIFAASRYLRYSDIRITSKLYADTKTLVSAGLGALLKPAGNLVEGVFTPQAEAGEGAPEQRQRRER